MKQTTAATRRHRKVSSDQRIGRDDWVWAGLELLANGGIDAVRVEPLAAHLGVTKGSFYWHFADRAALHAAMLEAWRGRSTNEIIERVEAGTGSGAERLKRLVALVTSNKMAPRLETAIRAWATTSSQVARVLADVDRGRLDYVTQLLIASGLGPTLAKARANFLYLALIGSFFADRSTVLGSDSKLWRNFTKTILR